MIVLPISRFFEPKSGQATAMPPITLSWDELFQVLLFLPGSDVCHYSQINSTAYDCIRSNQHLWAVLFKRDFELVLQSFLLTTLTADTAVQHGRCDEMGAYACFHAKFGRFPFYRVQSHAEYDDPGNRTLAKVVLGVADSRLNLPVIDTLRSKQLEIPQDDTPSNMIGIDFRTSFMASRELKTTPNLVVRFWLPCRNLDRIATLFYRDTQCLVIAVNTKHAWNEHNYSTNHPKSDFGSNSLSRAFAALKECKLHVRFKPPSPCKGVLIVGVGAWSAAAPISKERFLKDCARSFDILPLEYFELTCDNASEMSDLILRRIYTFHQQTLEDGCVDQQVQPIEKPEVVTSPQSICILS